MAESLYIILVIILCFMFYHNGTDNISVKESIFLLACLVVIIAFRPSNMPDYDAYESTYYTNFIGRFEPLIYSIRNFCKSLGMSHIGFFAVMGLIPCVMKLFVIRKLSPYILASVLLWLSDLFILQEMIAISAALAQGLILLSIYFRCTDKKTYSVLVAILAIGAHYSSAVFLPCIFLSSEKHYRFLYVPLILISYAFAMVSSSSLYQLLSSTGIAQLETLEEMYENTREINVFNLLNTTKTLICLVLWFNVEKLAKENKNAIYLLKLLTIGCISIPLLFDRISMATRFCELFSIVEILLWPLLIHCIPMSWKFSPRQKRISIIIIALVLAFLNYTSYIMYDPDI